MFLHIGNEKVINTEKIIGIFDIEATTVSKHSRRFLSLAEKRKEAITVSTDLPKSFIVCADKKKQTVYISQLASSTLQKRVEQNTVTTE